MIMEAFDDSLDKEHRFITGIAGKKDYSIVTITKNGLSSAVGELRRILEAFENQNVPIDYVPSGIDTVSLVMDSAKVSGCLYSILGELQKKIKPDNIKVTDQIAIVAAVGRKMAFRAGVSGKIFERLGEHGISIRMISQGPDEMNIIVGVDNKDYANAIRILYNSFVK
jgi:aspartate kinase